MKTILSPKTATIGKKAEDLPEGTLLHCEGSAAVFIRIGTQVIGFRPSASPWITNCNIYPNWTVAPKGIKITLEQE